MSAVETRTYFHSLHQILVAYDDSPFARHAFGVALALADRGEAEVTAVHVIPEMTQYFRSVLYPYAALGDDAHAVEAELLEAAKRHLLNATSEMRKHYSGTEQGDEIYAHIFHGPIVERIRESIVKTNANLVVVGAFGKSPPTPGQIGNVARRLIASSTRPVLLVKDPGGPVAVRKVLVALDGSPASAALLNYAISFTLLHDADLEIVSAIPDPRRGDREDLLSALKLPRDAKRKAIKTAESNIQRAVEQMYVPFPLEERASKLSLNVHLPVGDPLDCIVKVVAENEVDVVVTGSRHPKNDHNARFGRVADGLSRLAPAHVLTIPVDLLIDAAE